MLTSSGYQRLPGYLTDGLSSKLRAHAGRFHRFGLLSGVQNGARRWPPPGPLWRPCAAFRIEISECIPSLKHLTSFRRIFPKPHTKLNRVPLFQRTLHRAVTQSKNRLCAKTRPTAPTARSSERTETEHNSNIELLIVSFQKRLFPIIFC